MSDFILDFISHTAGAVSPERFRKWTAISMLASALGRTVWVKTSKGPIYPNLFVLLVGPPGAGKSIIDTAKEMLKATKAKDSVAKAFHVASDSVTAASLVDELAKAKGIKLLPEGPPLVTHQLSVLAEELQVLLPAYDTGIVGKLNSLYNNSKVPYSESRRTGSVRELTIENPCLNILAGAQPAYFAATFPEEMWNTGFARRIILIYSAEPQIAPLWGEDALDTNARAGFHSRLAAAADLWGQFRLAPAAASYINDWHMAKGPPVPKHSKLAQYIQGRTVNVVKLSMISAISAARGQELVLTLEDAQRGLSWLLEAERYMPDVFRAMIGHSDSHIIEELHLYAWATWSRTKKAVRGGQLMEFLLERAPSEKAERILLMMERAGILVRQGGSQDLYIPKPRGEHGMVE